jgi:hypothetical protein
MTERFRGEMAARPSRHLAGAALGVLAALAITMLAGCARGGGAPSGSITHPTGDALVLRVATAGGFLGPGVAFSQLPSVSIYGDGRVIAPGAVDMIYPGPALPPLLVTRLNEAGLQAVLGEVLSTGLFARSRSFQGASAVIADAGTTVFTLHADGRDATVSIYALGALDSSQPRPGISGEELAAHRTLAQLSSRLATLNSWLPASSWSDRESQPFTPDAIRLLVRNADADAPDQSGIANQLVPWPGAGDPATFGEPAAQTAGSRCGVVTGAGAATWFDAVRAANQLTRFTAHADRYEVNPRPLLPDEPRSCPTS